VKEKSENRRVTIGDSMVGLGGLEPPTSPLSGAFMVRLGEKGVRTTATWDRRHQVGASRIPLGQLGNGSEFPELVAQNFPEPTFSNFTC
jgi:hypothetical protein